MTEHTDRKMSLVSNFAAYRCGLIGTLEKNDLVGHTEAKCGSCASGGTPLDQDLGKMEMLLLNMLLCQVALLKQVKIID